MFQNNESTKHEALSAFKTNEHLQWIVVQSNHERNLLHKQQEEQVKMKVKVDADMCLTFALQFYKNDPDTFLKNGSLEQCGQLDINISDCQ